MSYAGLVSFGLATFLLSMTLHSNSHSEEIDVWLGTGNAKTSKGIYRCRLNIENGKLSDSQLVAEISGPGFLALHPKKPVLYAVGALENTPVVAAYAIENGSGTGSTLRLLNSVAIGDGGAAHVSVEPTGKTLLTAQYGTGSVAAFSLAADGSLNQQTALIKHEGPSRVVPSRQEAPHAHWTGFSPDNRFAFVPDLGMDKVVIYKLNPVSSTISHHGYGELPAGSGPRHMKFHANGKWIYVLNELAVSVSVFDYDADSGTMTLKQTIQAVPKKRLSKESFVSASEIRIHPSGKFVYSANRGHDTITVFSVDQDNGKLKFVERENVRGATPRNFNLDPSAKWLLAGGQDSNTLASFSVNSETGELSYNRSIINTPAPICVLFERE
jgi:6-phosphogluconolactonase